MNMRLVHSILGMACLVSVFLKSAKFRLQQPKYPLCIPCVYRPSLKRIMRSFLPVHQAAS